MLVRLVPRPSQLNVKCDTLRRLEKLERVMTFRTVLFGRRYIGGVVRVSRKFGKDYGSCNILKLEERGMLSGLFPDTSANEIFDLVVKKSQTVYAGFDPTADSLHVGNLLVLLNLFHWQRGGHQAIVLLGGATAQIGDPSGKSQERNELYKVEIKRNCTEIESQLQDIINNHECLLEKISSLKFKPIKIVNNAEWYENMNVVKFIGHIGRNFRVGTMLGKQSVRDRISSGSGISFTEFSYQILQAYDWLHLYESYKCKFQIGGNDQLGNICAGHDLIDKIHHKNVYGLTVPIVTNEEGDKFGKSAGNAIWLSKKKTSPFQLYQFFVRAKDSEVQKLLMLYTFESIPKILEIMNEHWKHPENKIAQKFLAKEVTYLIHGEEGLSQAELATSALYDSNITTLSKLDASDICTVFQGATLAELLLKPGTTVLEAALSAGCFKTESDAIRIISAGGFYINQQRVNNMEEVLTPASHILPSNITVMRVGKKNYTIVKWL